MRRIAACLLAIVALLLAAGCGGGKEQPTVTVKKGPTLQFTGRQTYVFTLVPHLGPSGVIKLRWVRNGVVKTLAEFPFTHMKGTGSVAVEVSRHAIDVARETPPMGTSGGPFALPAGLTALTTAWTGDKAYGPSGDTGEQVFWLQTYYRGEPAASGSVGTGDFAALARASTQEPRKITYCLTLEVGGG